MRKSSGLSWLSMLRIPAAWGVLCLGILFGGGLGGFTLAFWSAGQIYEYQDTVDGATLPPVDAIVCLAGGRGRISTAADIWYRYWEMTEGPPRAAVPVLYLSGTGHQVSWPDVSKQIRRGVLPVLKPEYVLLERESENTEENVDWILHNSEKRGWKRILLVTSSYHMRRARLLLERLRDHRTQKLEIETLSVLTDPFEPGDWRASFQGIRVTITEYFKWLYTVSFWKPGPPGSQGAN